MLIDEVEVFFKAGDGGDGKKSFYPKDKAGPDGGNGGNGGSIYLTATSDLTSLIQFQGKRTRKAEDGQQGGKFQKTGKNGKDFIISLPIGCNITDSETGEMFELNDLEAKILLCKGGKGGKGTHDLATSINTTPMRAEPGQPGQQRNLKIILKLLADYGLIGLPNAGKSSLLNELTKANVKVADYPFTTLEPNLGVMGKKVLADIPGLIEGASTGKGLGIGFLKHIEKVNLLLHCIAIESKNIEADYGIIRQELEKFNPLLTQKPEIILLTKTDLAMPEEIKEKQKILEKFGKVLPVSIIDDQSLQKLKDLLLRSSQ